MTNGRAAVRVATGADGGTRESDILRVTTAPSIAQPARADRCRSRVKSRAWCLGRYEVAGAVTEPPTIKIVCNSHVSPLRSPARFDAHTTRVQNERRAATR